MDSGRDKPRSAEEPIKMPAIAQEVFELVGKNDIQANASVIQIADELITSPPADLAEQELPLLAYALKEHFKEPLTVEQSAALKAMSEEAGRDPMSLTAQTVKRVKVLRQSVRNYFRAPVASSDTVEISKIDNPVAKGVLLLEAHMESSRMNRDFKEKNQPNRLATAYVNPRSGEVGVWMSTAGIPFNPSALRK